MLNAGMSGDRKQTALHLAAKNNRLKEVEMLVDNAADVNVKDENGETPLHYAAQKGHLETVKLLIEKGQAEIDVLDGTKNTALHEAVKFDQFRTVKYLVKCGANVNSKDHASVSVLSHAVAAGCLMLVHFLVEKGAEINVVDENGLTPLRHAANSGQWEVVQYLVERGAELSEESGALKRAVEGGQWRLATLLIENGASTKHLTEEEISEVLRRNFISLEGEAEDVISGLMVLGNVQLLENYVNNNSEKILEQVLPKKYQEIQLLNIHLSPSVRLFVESYIIKSRLFSNTIIKNENLDKKTETESNNVMKRLNLVIECIENLERINSTLLGGNEMSDGFLFVAKFIARNMQILKNELRFSAIKLPWTEMQFCLINFISGLCGSLPKNLEFISTLILNKTRLMEHLSHFKTHLESLTFDLKFDRKLKFDKRKDFIASVLKSSPGFQSLFEDYEVLRDVYSLNRIASYLHVASALDLEKEEEEDGLVSERVILRALQVTGECLKNTEESPNMSDNVHRSLMAMAPTNIKEIVTSLRDSLSHVDHLHKVKDAEEQNNSPIDAQKDHNSLPDVAKDGKWLLGIQKDVMKLEYEITVQSLVRKDLAVKTFIRRIFECKCIKSAKDLVIGVGTMDADEMELNETRHNVIYKLIELIEKFKDVVKISTDYQRDCYRNLEFVLELLKGRWEKVKQKQAENVKDVKTLIFLIQGVEDGDDEVMELIRRKAGSQAAAINYEMKNETNFYDELLINVGNIYRSLGESDRYLHNQLYCQIVDLIEIEAKKAKSIDKLNAEMEKKSFIFDDNDESEKKMEKKVNEIMKEISKEFFGEDDFIRNEFLEQIDNKKELYRSRNQLVAYYNQIVRMYGEIYDNCVDVYNGLITSFQLLCDSFNNPEPISDSNRNQLLIKLIEENKLDQLLSELNLKTLVNEMEFKSVLEQIKSRKLTKIEEIFLKKSQIDKLLIDEVKLNYNSTEFSINLKKMFEILIKNSKKKVDLIDKNGKNRKKDEGKVAEVFDIGQSIEQIKVDLSMNEESFNVPALTKALNLSDQTLVLDDVSLANCKYLKQNLPKFDTYGKLVKEASNEAEMSKLSQPIKKFIQSFNLKFNKPEIANLAVEKVFQRLENQQKIRLKNFFIQKLDILTAIFPPEKTDLELLNLLKTDNNIRLSVEILLLNLTETLENLSFFDSNRLFLDEICPVLVGKNLRNYLAHGDPLINIILSINSYEISLINHFRLFQHKFSSQSEFYSDQFLIGKSSLENVDEIEDNYYNHSRSILFKKDQFISINQNTKINDFKKLFDKPMYLKVRDALEDTLLHYSAYADNLSLFHQLYNQGLSLFVKNKIGHSPIHEAIATGSYKIVQYLLKIGVYPSFIVENGETLLHLAVQFDHLNIVQLLLSCHADMEAVNDAGNTPIVDAVTYARKSIAVELLEAGCELQSRGIDGKTLAHLANAEILKVLLEKKVDLSALDHDLYTPLHSACYKGDEAVVVMLLDKEVDVTSRGRGGFLPLHIAATEGHLNVVQLLIEKNTELVDSPTFKKSTPLYYACFYGHLEIVKLLLANGADVNAKCVEDITPLHVATTMGRLDMMDILLDNDKLTIDSFSYGMTALHFAAKNGFLEGFKKLAAGGANVYLSTADQLSVLHLASHVENLQLMEYILDMDKELMESVDSRGETALHLCALYNRLNSLNFLIKSGANLEARDQAGNTPLLISALNNHTAIFSALSSNGAMMDVRNKDNWLVVHCAAQNNNMSIMKVLIERKMDLNARVKDGFSAIHFAAQNGHFEMLKLLINNGAQLHLRGLNDWSVLHLAASSDQQHIIRYLVKKAPELVNALTTDNGTALHLTAEKGNDFCVTLLIENGANIYAKTTSEWTALHFAAENGHSNTIEILLNTTYSRSINCAKNEHHLPENISVSDFVNAKTNLGLTALHLSADNGHFEVLKTLLKYQALVNIPDGNNDTALHLASGSSRLSCVQLLIENGADVNAKNETHVTPLHFAAEAGCAEIVEILLKGTINKVVEIDCKTDLDLTPMHLSAQNGHLEVVKLLLEHNSDVNARDNNQHTPLHHAASKGHHPIVDLLLRNNALTD